MFKVKGATVHSSISGGGLLSATLESQRYGKLTLKARSLQHCLSSCVETTKAVHPQSTALLEHIPALSQSCGISEACSSLFDSDPLWLVPQCVQPQRGGSNRPSFLQSVAGIKVQSQVISCFGTPAERGGVQEDLRPECALGREG